MPEGESHQESMKSHQEFKRWGSDSNSSEFEKTILGLAKARARHSREPKTVLEFLKSQQLSQDLEEQNAFRKALHEKLDRLNGEAGAQDEKGQMRLTLLQVLLLILAASLSVPVNAAAESLKETQKQAA